MGKPKPKQEIEDSEDEREDTPDFSLFGFAEGKEFVDSTHIAPVELDMDTQRLLMTQIRGMLPPLTDTNTWAKTMSRINWSKIKIDGLSAEKAKEEFEKIVKPVRKIRTLTEVMDELERNPMKYCHDLPKQPPGPTFIFINENREKFIGKKGKMSVPEISKYGAEKYKALSDEKRAVYEEKAKKLREEYLEKMEAFYEKHPELKKTKKREREALKVDTPFNLYVNTQQITSEVPLNREELRNAWKILPVHEKAEFIKAVLMGPDDGRKKVISKEERKIVDQANGVPERPLTAFTIFVKDYNQKHPGEADLFKHAAQAWGNLNEKEKGRYTKIQKKSYIEYKEKAEEYIRKLPLHEQLAARKTLQVTAGKKRKAATSTSSKSDANGGKWDDEDGFESDEHEAVPAKRIKKEEPEEDIKIPTKSSKSNESKKVAEPAKTTAAIKEPEIPIQRVELYFMKHVHKGPDSELKSAFDSLSTKKREKYEQIVDTNRKNFMASLESYIQSVDKKEQEKFKHKVQQVFKEQEELIGWSKVKNDSDSDSSSESDGESSDESE